MPLQVRVDIHLGKLRQGRFIPGPVGIKFSGSFLLRNERCLRIQEKFLAQREEILRTPVSESTGPLTLPAGALATIVKEPGIRRNTHVLSQEGSS